MFSRLPAAASAAKAASRLNFMNDKGRAAGEFRFHNQESRPP
jgi:hypothetical protein